MAALLRAQTELFAESRPGLSSQPPSATVSAKPNPVLVSIEPSYLQALQALGHSESEARFLYLVATHSGYFVARQFLAFTCGHWGETHDHVLEQTSSQETRAHGVLPKEGEGLSRLLSQAVPPDR
jgi:hypothetical protein